MMIFVTRASEGGAHASDTAAANPPMSKVKRCCESLLGIVIVISPLCSVIVSVVVILALMLARLGLATP